MTQASYFKPALAGGCIAGFLSVIPIVELGCCLWAMVGGAVAVYILTTSAAAPITYGEGAIVGILAGLVGAVISGVIDLLFGIIGLGVGMVFLERLADHIPQLEEYVGMATIGAGIMVVVLFLSIIIFAIFGTVGGVIGTAIFAKKEKEPPAKA